MCSVDCNEEKYLQKYLAPSTRLLVYTKLLLGLMLFIA